MKFMLAQLSYFFRERQARRNLSALTKYAVFVLAVISVYSVLFHLIMLHFEGEQHSWLTGFYWTLTVMSTLGFGDITFHTDIGRIFSIIVLLSGIILLLIMLPFTFIRYFYAPWLEAQIRFQAPRAVPEGTKNHVIICRHDSIAPGLIKKLEFNQIPYFVVEKAPAVAGELSAEGISVIVGEIDSRETFESLRVEEARMVVANHADTVNTNITLTVREISSRVPIVSLVDNEESIDILELSGATHVLPLKRKLGELLASRVNIGDRSYHVTGRFKDLLIAEFTVHGTPLVGQTVRETRLRELTGANLVAVWHKGHLRPVRPDDRLQETTIPVVIGNEQQLAQLGKMLGSDQEPARPALILGGGKVGLAAARFLRRRGVRVHLVEKEERLRRFLEPEVDWLVMGDAADRKVLDEAGIGKAGAVLLTTADDAVNIYLAVYCRRLRRELNIVSRVTHERNIEAIYRAGSDYLLSYASLGRECVVAMLLGREPIMVGEGADFFAAAIPASLQGRTLAESQIGTRTGLIVIAVEEGSRMATNPGPGSILPAGGRLLMLGTAEQRRSFSTEFD